MFYVGPEQATTRLFFSFWYGSWEFNSTEEFTCIWQSKRVGIIAREIRIRAYEIEKASHENNFPEYYLKQPGLIEVNFVCNSLPVTQALCNLVIV